MVEDFGKQFTVARETLGLSIKDVSSKIKIREDYISDIENNIFDFPLPNIYIRGFIRNYARLLKLDVDKVMAQCPVSEFQIDDNIKPHSGDVVEFIKDADYEANHEQPQASKLGEKVKGLSRSLSMFKDKVASLPRRTVVFSVSGLGAVLLIIIMVMIFVSNRDKFDITGIVPTEAMTIPTRSITLSATGNVNIVVRNKDTLEKIYAGGLVSGTVKTIAYYKPIQVFYDRGEYLLIQQDNGEKVCPQPGRGGVEIK